jgi:hypothetical protein
MSFFSWLRNCNRSQAGEHSRPSGAPRKRASFRPQVEALEERWVPSFAAPVDYPVGANPQAVVTADLNHDHKPDLVTANQGTYDSATSSYVGGGVSVLLALSGKNGAPTGTFAPARNYPVGSAIAVAIGDINHDGNVDIVTGNGGVLLGNGDGTFRIGSSYAGGLGAYVGLADVNGDGNLDIVTANLSGPNFFSGAGAVSVLPGKGDGTFGAGWTYATGSTLRGVALGDFNSDGKLDLVIANDVSVNLLPGNGDGTFGTAHTIGSAGPLGQIVNLTTGDFNSDGKLDVAFGVRETGYSGDFGHSLSAQVLLSNGNGTFLAAQGGGFSVDPATSVGLVATDFNHDGKLDLITLDSTPWSPVRVLAGNGDGSFGAEVDYSTPLSLDSPTACAVGDFNGDGYTDVVTVGIDYKGAYVVEVLLWDARHR